MKSVRLWLRVAFDIDPTVENNTLAHGTQRDTYNCGPASANTIEHNVFGVQWWTTAAAFEDRMLWFTRFAGSITQKSDAMASTDTEMIAGDTHCDQVTSEDDQRQREGLSIAALLNPEPGVEQVQHERLSLEDLLNPASDYVPWGLDYSQFDEDTLTPVEDADGDADCATEDEKDGSGNDGKGRDDGDGDDSSDGDGDGDDTQANWLYNKDGTRVEPAATISKKRKRNDDDKPFISDSDSYTSDQPTKCSKTSGKPDGSKSAKASLAKRKAFRSGTLVIAPMKLDQWRRAVLRLDPHAVFNKANICQIRHSQCGRFHAVKEPLDLTRWRQHVKECGQSAMKDNSRANTRSLTSYFGVKAPKNPKKALTATSSGSATPVAPATSGTLLMRSCPGLSDADDERIEYYLRRVFVVGGGGISIHKIARSLFGKKFMDLTKAEKERVWQDQLAGHTWRVDQRQLKVFSTGCLKEVPDTNGPNRILPCAECQNVLRSSKFKKALRKPKRKPENTKYLNKIYCGTTIGELYAECVGLRELIEQPVSVKIMTSLVLCTYSSKGAKDSPYVRYAMGVLTGKYTDKIFNGLVKAWMHREDREVAGKGLQNFKYTEEYYSFCRVLAADSPLAYRNFKSFFPGPNLRSIQRHTAKQGRFPVGISDRNFELISDHLKKIDYTGVASLACDDSKARKALRLMFDSKEDSWFLIGGTDGPVRVLDPENMAAILEENIDKTAVKVCTYHVRCVSLLNHDT